MDWFKENLKPENPIKIMRTSMVSCRFSIHIMGKFRRFPVFRFSPTNQSIEIDIQMAPGSPVFGYLICPRIVILKMKLATILVGGLEHVLFSPIVGMMIQSGYIYINVFSPPAR